METFPRNTIGRVWSLNKIAKSYKNLQAKLQEIQSILDQALLLGPETQSPDSFSNDIKHKLAFIGNLLAAQVSSHHPSKPHHLHHISERLSTMESDFHHWDSFRSLPCHDFDIDSLLALAPIRVSTMMMKLIWLLLKTQKSFCLIPIVRRLWWI